MTHTYATLEVSPSAYDEIASKLREASYHHAFYSGAIDMQGIGLVRGTPDVPFLYQHALSELQLLGYTVEGGDLMPPQDGVPVRQAALVAAPPATAVCEMRGDAEGLWWTACGADPWLFEEGGPKENRVRHCFNCGKPVRIVPHLETEAEA